MTGGGGGVGGGVGGWIPAFAGMRGGALRGRRTFVSRPLWFCGRSLYPDLFCKAR